MSQYPPPPAPPAGAMPQQYSLNPQPKTSGAAIGSLICGILGCVPWLTGLLAIVLGIVGIKSTSNPLVRGRGMAITGLVLGLLSVVVWTLFSGAIWAFFQAAAPAREQARSFIQDLDKGNVPAAQARCTSSITTDELTLTATHLKEWGGVKNITLPAAILNKSAGTATTANVGGGVEFGNLTKAFTATLVKEGETYKIREFRFE